MLKLLRQNGVYLIMRKSLFHYKTGIYPILWIGIIIAAIYILIRFILLSFSGNMGQAVPDLRTVVASDLCRKTFITGSSLIDYIDNEGSNLTFPLSVFSDQFALQDFINEDTYKTIQAQNQSEMVLNTIRFPNTNNNRTNTVNPTKSNHESYSDISQKTKRNTLGMDIYEIETDQLSVEYILTNGAMYNNIILEEYTNAKSKQMNDDQLQIGYLEGEIERETDDGPNSVETVNLSENLEYTMERMKDIDFLIRNFYIVHPSTKVTDTLFDSEKLLSKDMTIKQDNELPQILIYHTHASESYADSKSGEKEDTVVGVGSYLAKILEEDYGYNVIHDTKRYDEVNRDIAYNYAYDGISKILEKNPSIEVVIDLHRDSGAKRSTKLNGEETAQIMLFNGLSRDQNGPITSLDNPNLQDNLAFSLQLQLEALDRYPGLFYRNYLKCYRYNMHVRPKCILMELGTNKNSLKSAMNAMKPFAEILDAVLQGK